MRGVRGERVGIVVVVIADGEEEMEMKLCGQKLP